MLHSYLKILSNYIVSTPTTT